MKKNILSLKVLLSVATDDDYKEVKALSVSPDSTFLMDGSPVGTSR